MHVRVGVTLEYRRRNALRLELTDSAALGEMLECNVDDRWVITCLLQRKRVGIIRNIDGRILQVQCDNPDHVDRRAVRKERCRLILKSDARWHACEAACVKWVMCGLSFGTRELHMASAEPVLREFNRGG